MKSCRNCQHATHNGGYWVGLDCKVKGITLMRPTLNDKENKQIDQTLRNTGERCYAYKEEPTCTTTI
jgi:hypothetical protein